jgi:hypothetical protein
MMVVSCRTADGLNACKVLEIAEVTERRAAGFYRKAAGT